MRISSACLPKGHPPFFHHTSHKHSKEFVPVWWFQTASCRGVAKSTLGPGRPECTNRRVQDTLAVFRQVPKRWPHASIRSKDRQIQPAKLGPSPAKCNSDCWVRLSHDPSNLLKSCKFTHSNSWRPHFFSGTDQSLESMNNYICPSCHKEFKDPTEKPNKKIACKFCGFEIISTSRLNKNDHLIGDGDSKACNKIIIEKNKDLYFDKIKL